MLCVTRLRTREDHRARRTRPPAIWADSAGDGAGDLAGLTQRLDYQPGPGITTL